MTTMTIDEITIGDSYESSVVFDEEKVAEFINFSQDTAGIHTSKEFSSNIGYNDLVVHGFCISLFFSRILGLELPGENTVIGSLNLDFHNPVYVGDTVKYSVVVKRLIHSMGSVVLKLTAQKNDNETCVAGTAVCVFKKKDN